MSTVRLRRWMFGMACCAVAATMATAGGNDDSVSDDWLRAVTEDIRRSEYHFSVSEDGAWSAPNRAHDLRARFGEDRLELCSRTEGCGAEDEGWFFTLQVTRLGRGPELAAVERAPVTADEHRVEIRRDDFVEWYVNDEKGLEQGFTIDAPLRGDRQASVVIEMDVGGGLRAYPSEDGQAVVSRASGGRDVLRYSKLIVRDATGEDVPASLDFEGGRLRIVIDDAYAVYPLEVDPLMTSPAWTVEPDIEGWFLGVSVAAAGDVNGDGFGDVIVGAPGYDYLYIGVGRAYVYHGSASGLSTVVAWEDSGILGEGAAFGATASTAGDINGDGYDDVIVGSPTHPPFSNGKVYVYHGSETGLSTGQNWTVNGGQSGGKLGSSVGWAGDVNGDGYDDVVVGAPGYTGGGSTGAGMAFVWLGSDNGLGSNFPFSADWRAQSDQSSVGFGESVGTAGDVNGDGFDDVIVGAQVYDDPEDDEGVVFVWHGSVSGLGPIGTPANADWTAQGDQAGAEFGASVGTAGDLDGDGFADVFIGAPYFDDPEDAEGAVFVFSGSSTGLGASGNPGNADWIAQSDQAGAWLGISASTLGDVNGDGFSDLIVGAKHYDVGPTDVGAAFAWFGGPSGLGMTGSPSNADWIVEGDQEQAQYGYSVATAGDVDGDGFSDAIVGCPYYDNGELNEGRAYVYHGGPTGPSTSTSGREPNQDDAAFGSSVASAGDVDGDGYGDVIVGAYRYDNGEIDEGMAFLYLGSPGGLQADPHWTAESNQVGASLGRSVASAGDVNGDGYSDVIIGAPYYSNPEEEEGAAFVWLGSATGMGRDGSPRNAHWSVESDQGSLLLGPLMGWSVASAGDVNGDGYGDVIVGVPGISKGSSARVGVAEVYLGSATGLDTTAHWNPSGGQVDERFGSSVASAGDVNGDGFSDVIVGAHLFDNGQADEGRAVVYLGSDAGLGSTIHWTAEADQASAWLGISVASAGDVNGDGFSDVIVGAPGYDTALTDAGKAFVWYGGASGLGPNGTPLNADWNAESDLDNSEFGNSVASAGDVNGDGYSDVIVGAHEYNHFTLDDGGAFVWFGSATGPGAVGDPQNADWSAPQTHLSGGLGSSVASAGDVDGDGYSDVIVGAPRYEKGHTDEGLAYIYLGNDGGGLDRAPLQTRIGTGDPIHLLGRSDDDNSFRLVALGRSPLGRGEVWLEWEAKPLGTPFDGTGLGQGALTDTGAAGPDGSVALLEELVDGLSPATRYHWRMRVRVESPLYKRSPWFSLAYNGMTETDVLTGGFPDLDGDGVQSDADCDDGDDQVWAVPGEAEYLTFNADKVTLRWAVPAEPGGVAVWYDTVRADDPTAFDSAGTCVEWDSVDTTTSDAQLPGVGVVFHYLVRPENPCGSGSLGRMSDDTERLAVPCP